MRPFTGPRSGSRLLVDQLTIQGLDHLFCAPGQGLAALEADLPRAVAALTLAEDDLGAALMALSYGMLTARPGVCLLGGVDAVARSVPALLAACRDGIPMVVLSLLPPAAIASREGAGLADVAGGLCKAVLSVTAVQDVPEQAYKAFALAAQGQPGPVVLGMPLDLAQQVVETRSAPRHFPVEAHPGPADIMRVQNLLWESKRPLMVLGGAAWSPDASAAAERFAAYHQIPVVVEHRAQGLMDCESPLYAGDLGPHANPALLEMVAASDTLLVVGGALSPASTAGLTLLARPEPRQALIHVHPAPDRAGLHYAMHHTVQAHPKAFFEAAEEHMLPPQNLPWRAVAAQAREAYLAWNTDEPAAGPHRDVAQIVTFLRARMPQGSIACSGSGAHVHWLDRYLRPRGFGERMSAPEGLYGGGIAAALAAQRLNPEKLVVAFASRRGFLQRVDDLAVAARHRLPVMIVVLDNGGEGADCAAVARAYGLAAQAVPDIESFYGAFEKALASRRATVLHFAPAGKPAAKAAPAAKKGQNA